MSTITGEITRISGNVSDSLTEVGNKGVVVPVGANSDDLAGLIRQIQQGGGTENPFFSLTDLQYMFDYRDLNTEGIYDAVERFSRNNITGLNHTFYNASDSDYQNQKDLMTLIKKICTNTTISNFGYALANFINYNAASYNKVLDLSDLKVSGTADHGFNATGSNNGTLKIKLKSDSFDTATRVDYLFSNTRPSIKFELNENKLYFRNVTDTNGYDQIMQNTNRTGVFVDSNDVPITEITIYLELSTRKHTLNSSFYGCLCFERINFNSTEKISTFYDTFVNCDNLKSLSGINLSGLSSTTNRPFGESSTNHYLTNFGDFGLVTGSTLGTTNNLQFKMNKIWHATADTVIDGQTVGYWYEKFANALGNKAATGTQTITINTTLYNSLTATQIALITDKGYTLAHAA